MPVNRFRQYSLGAVLWVLSVQYFIMQIVVAVAWSQIGYSWANNTISDLGNTQCDLYGSRLVCSPFHTVMNISFIILGVTMIGGAILLQRRLANSRFASMGFGCMALAGVGTILIGLFPENSISSLHITGAALPFIFGNLGMIAIGVDLKRLPTALRFYTIVSGVLGLLTLLLFMMQTYAGIGIGGMERLVSYPQSIWMIIFGTYLLRADQSAVKK